MQVRLLSPPLDRRRSQLRQMPEQSSERSESELLSPPQPVVLNFSIMRFIWDSKYSVSIRSIDLQHQRFFEIINEIYDLVHKVYFTKDELLKVVKDLETYAETHLSYEEKYFTEFNYPDTKIHIAAHDAFRQNVKKYMADVTSADPKKLEALATDIAEFSKNWLSDHILNLDHKYTQFFIVHDIK